MCGLLTGRAQFYVLLCHSCFCALAEQKQVLGRGDRSHRGPPRGKPHIQMEDGDMWWERDGKSAQTAHFVTLRELGILLVCEVVIANFSTEQGRQGRRRTGKQSSAAAMGQSKQLPGTPATTTNDSAAGSVLIVCCV
ncbi:hypothetical protein Ddc_05488 [Ditylenchus destructor]|nr:hypothetical protein Ddc_05488 [Ditylenchus destructor]